jgi:hypothetical protein
MKRTFIAALVLSAATATGAMAQGSTKQDNMGSGASEFAPGQIQRDKDIPAKENAPGQRAQDTDMPAKEFAPGQRMNEEKDKKDRRG